MTSRALALLTAIAFTTSWANAQSTFGTMVGVVKDSGALVVAGAQVNLTGLDDGSRHTATTGGDGTFEFMNLKAGNYQVTVRAIGFADLKMRAVQLDVRQTLRLDVGLKVKSSSEIVEVADTVPMINTENAILADTKDFVQVSQLPVNYRGATTSSLAMVATVPGAQQDANGNVSVGGGLPSQVQYSVDGASTVNVRQNGALANMNPSSELISEFKVVQFSNNAEFAQLGDITIATKSGSDHFHGCLFEYMQNSVLDATTYGFSSKPFKAFNTFGGSLGGPVNIPGVDKEKLRTFFFVAYEGNRRRLVTPLFLNVPSPTMRSGNLNELTGPFGRVVDPLTGQPFANNTIPVNRINPVSASLLQNYLTQLPNSSRAGSNYLQQTSTPSNTDGYDVRIDHTLTPKQRSMAAGALKYLFNGADCASTKRSRRRNRSKRDLLSQLCHHEYVGKRGTFRPIAIQDGCAVSDSRSDCGQPVRLARPRSERPSDRPCVSDFQLQRRHRTHFNWPRQSRLQNRRPSNSPTI